MNLEQQVCSLKHAKQLKELGVKQDSLFYWGAYENPLRGIVSQEKCPDDEYCIYYCEDIVYKKCPPDWSFSAYTVAEFSEMFPIEVSFKKSHEIIGKGKDYCRYDFKKDNEMRSVLTVDHSEANSRARMMIFIIENCNVKL